MNTILKGVRVLDCTRLIPGPFATHLLAEMGAEVLKIEQPEVGDYARELEPRVDGTWTVFRSLNRNKRSISLDLKHPKGREIFLKLVETSDVVIESFRPGVMDKLDLGFDVCKCYNPNLIYASLTGWGQTGPYAQLAGHDINYLSIAGLIGLSTTSTGEPAILGTQIADFVGGYHGAMTILAALYERTQRPFHSIYLDIAMLDAVLAMELIPVLNTLSGRRIKPRDDLLLGKYVCYNLYETSDGRYVSLGCSEKKFWERFCHAIDRQEWSELQLSEANGEGIHGVLKEIFKSKTMLEWAEIGEFSDCCLFPVLDSEEVLKHPQVKSRNMLVGDSKGLSVGVRSPISSAMKSSLTLGNSIPTLGQDTEHILMSLGYKRSDIDLLREQKVI